MTTITKAQKEEITILYKDKDINETISIDSGEIVYNFIFQYAVVYMVKLILIKVQIFQQL